MANRFGKSYWQDADRLNLLKVCHEHQQWEERLGAMKEIYKGILYQPGYFTENCCREELERIMSSPTPNLRIDPSHPVVFSRKIMMEKWIRYFENEVRKQRSSQAEVGLVTIRNNVALMKEVSDPDISPERLNEILELIEISSGLRIDDGDMKRVIGSLDTAIYDQMNEGGTSGLETFELPPTKPPAADFDTGTKGYLTPIQSTEDFDMSFFSPLAKSIEMRTIADALKEAIPTSEPDTFFEPTPPIDDALPDDIMEPTSPSPVKEPKTEEMEEEEEEEEEEKEVDGEDEEEAEAEDEEEKEEEAESDQEQVESDQGQVESDQEDVDLGEEMEVDDEEERQKSEEPEESPAREAHSSNAADTPASPKPASQPSTPVRKAPKTPPRKKEPTPPPVKVEDIKEETESPSPVPEHPSSPAVRTRGRSRPSSGNASTSAQGTSRRGERGISPVDETPETRNTATRKRIPERSEEPLPSSSAKKSRGTPLASSSSRKRKEETPSSRVSSATQMTRSESGFDLHEVPDSFDSDAIMFEVETQSDISISHTFSEAQLAANARESSQTRSKPASHTGQTRVKKTQLAGEVARSDSRNSSTSTMGLRSGSVTRNPGRTIASQTNRYVDLIDDDNFVVGFNSRPTYIRVAYELESSKGGQISMETCREIDAENEAAGKTDEAERAPRRVTKHRNLIVVAETAIGNRLINEQNFTLASDVIGNMKTVGLENSPPKKRKKEDAPEKARLLTMHRKIYDCEWSEAFRRAVPIGEETYDLGIRERIDLGQIKREIDCGEVNNEITFLLRAFRMLSNAVMYNGYDHDVHIYAKNIFAEVMTDITGIGAEQNHLILGRRRYEPIGTQYSSSTASSIEAEPTKTINAASAERTVTVKNLSHEGIMTPYGNRRAKKNIRGLN